MNLLLTADGLLTRRAIAAGALAPLTSGLRRELSPLIAAPTELPREKALLSRAGGRCASDGALLRFDPWDPRHRCPLCSREYAGAAHDRFRLYWYQLWLAERVLHAALLGVVNEDADARATACDLLARYADQYLRYPNTDNVLGPSRPFFSTYLESIWLLQLMLALDLMETGAPSSHVSALGGVVRDRLILPSIALIASYDEGMSNRQVWNNAALLAGASLLGRPAIAERAVRGSSGLFMHLDQALLADGSWYEGENYHHFAHRGLWYGVQLARAGGEVLPRVLEERYREGFAAPFRTLLPDLTFPSRRDSQYAVSVRQPRFAESLELGLAEHDDERLAAMLARLYLPDIARGDTGRASSSADVERNLGATALTRADLSWRSILFARDTLPASSRAAPTSDLLAAQGLAVLRRERGRIYVSLDYGHSGGGHGHPDRLNLTLMDGPTRWFDDPGTGSYVDQSLHWYRSTLAHNAPLVDGRSQPRVHGQLKGYDEQSPSGWMSASVQLAPGLTVTRTVVVHENYLVDEVAWLADEPHHVALPIHQVELIDDSGTPLRVMKEEIGLPVDRAGGLAFLEALQCVSTLGLPARARGVVALADGARLDGWIQADRAATWWRASAPPPPGIADRHPVAIVSTHAASGQYLSVWSWRAAVTRVAVEGPTVIVHRADGETDRHCRTANGWRILGSRKAVELGGLIKVTSAPSEAAPEPVAQRSPAQALPAEFALGERHYRRSEQSWTEAGSPRAAVSLTQRDVLFSVQINVAPSDRLFVPIEAENPLDNEPAAINGDGVQLYIDFGESSGGWLLAPERQSTSVGVRAIEGWGDIHVDASWAATATGYALLATVPVPRGSGEVSVDVVVNETASGRDRRRGQLVLSGADGEFVYLRGDRHDPSRLLRFTLAHD